MKPIELSHLTKFENKNIYPPTYKHMLEALQKAYLYVYDNHGNGLFVDGRIYLRFKVGGGFETIELTPDALYNLLKSQLTGEHKYQYELHGEPRDFTKVEVD